MRSLLITFTLFTVNWMFIAGQQKKNPLYEAYINKYKDLAVQQQKLYKIPASITLAQGILETAAGTSRLAREANNHFGIKCKEEWTGKRIYHDDDEKGECFRAYKSASDSYLDHSLFLSQRKYYVSLFQLDPYDYRGWAYGLQKCGYATDKTYGSKLVGIIESYALYKYDKMKGVERMLVADGIYDIKLDTQGASKKLYLRRRIYETNKIHYITAQENDSYDIIGYDTRIKTKRLLKYNETTADHKLKSGEMVFIQAKRKHASKEHRIHTVKAGESLHGISQIYGMRLKSLYKLNRIREGYIPTPGDNLRVRK